MTGSFNKSFCSIIRTWVNNVYLVCLLSKQAIAVVTFVLCRLVQEKVINLSGSVNLILQFSYTEWLECSNFSEIWGINTEI